jgi:YihY family inner membrane protein
VSFPPRWLKAILDRIDRLQQRHQVAAFAVAVQKRYGDDRGGMYSALITFYGLLSVFPLLLLFITAASRILGPSSSATQSLVNSALKQFPTIGSSLAANIHALNKGHGLATVASALFLLWGALGVTSALQASSHEAWRRPRHHQPNLWIRTARGLLLLGVIATSVILTTVSASFAASGYLTQFSSWLAPALIVVGALINIGAYLLALKILAPKPTGFSTLLPGALVGGIGWSALQQVGGYLISHQLHRTAAIYGLFATVLGLIFWLNLGARLFLYANEINIVRAQRAWPRGLFEPSDAAKASIEAEEAAQADAEN